MTDARTPKTRCTAITKAGKPCPHATLAGKTVCFAHAESETKAEHGREGGKVKHANERARRAAEIAQAQSVALATAEQMRAALERALGRVEALALEPIAMANATARLVTAALAVRGQLDLERQFAELRAEVDKLAAGRAA